jgi:hypothetical protein
MGFLGRDDGDNVSHGAAMLHLFCAVVGVAFFTAIGTALPLRGRLFTCQGRFRIAIASGYGEDFPAHGVGTADRLSAQARLQLISAVTPRARNGDVHRSFPVRTGVVARGTPSPSELLYLKIARFSASAWRGKKAATDDSCNLVRGIREILGNRRGRGGS